MMHSRKRLLEVYAINEPKTGHVIFGKNSRGPVPRVELSVEPFEVPGDTLYSCECYLSATFRLNSLRIFVLNDDYEFVTVQGIRIGITENLVEPISSQCFGPLAFACELQCTTGEKGSPISIQLRNDSPEPVTLAMYGTGLYRAEERPCK